MKETEIIVIGAGASGLMAAYTLANAGKSVIVLEARNRTGGRIHTYDHASFFNYAELGAEFVHGNLPLTFSLLNEAYLDTIPAEGEAWRHENGKFSQNDMLGDSWEQLMQKLSELQQDVPLNQFLDKYFPDEKYQKLKTSVRQYVAGYDTGDADKASSFALRQEWQNEDESAQHRITKGYCSLVNHLVQSCRSAGVSIYLNEPVQKIEWRTGEVHLITAAGAQYLASKLITTVPLGVLQNQESAGAVKFYPEISEHTSALQQMGFGDIIKILLQFDHMFWEDDTIRQSTGADLKDMEFLFSKESIPTWWTQAPNQSPLLTGWLGGPPAATVKHCTNEELLGMALKSLGNIFSLTPDHLKAKLVAWHIANWSADPYTRGSYAYDTVASPAARRLLNNGVENTLFFAGEYLYEGPAMGTVEAALVSGKQTAEYILTKY